MRKLTQEEFLARCRKKHNGKISYEKAVYTASNKKVKLICLECGMEFEQLAKNHMNGEGCPRCANKRKGAYRKNSFDDFKNTATEKWDGKYNYSISEPYYENNRSIIPIICPIHGIFWQKVFKHTQGHGCQKCSVEKTSKNHIKSVEDFVTEASQKHNFFYDYSLVPRKYLNGRTKVEIICPKHGIFRQTPSSHLCGKGCSQCGHERKNDNRKVTFEQFVKRSTEKYGEGKFQYDKEDFHGEKKPMRMRCVKCGLVFERTPEWHLHAQDCPCSTLFRLETKIKDVLNKRGIKYEPQKTFEWLKYKGVLRLDFYLPDYHTAIECQGIQHFEPIDFPGKGKEWAERAFGEIRIRDGVKKKLCEEHNVRLLYFSYNENVNEFEEKLKCVLS